MVSLSPFIQSYAWGSRTALPELCGSSLPARHPIAEYWFGAHHSGPSRCPDGKGLDSRIAADPVSELGERVVSEHGERLPFLVKLLSANQSLSLQAHPSRERAREGYAAEERRAVPINAPERNYRDDNHKPEILVALTEFHALAGFRPTEQTVALLDALRSPRLRRYMRILDEHPGPKGLRAVFTSLVTLSHETSESLVSELVSAAVGYLASFGYVGEWSDVAATLVDLAGRYPGDSGVLVSLLLNRIVLRPGEAVYIGPGQLHAYLSGVGVEVMASSDNVLRGGLTPKHVDVHELNRVLEFESLADPTIRAVSLDGGLPGEVAYLTPARDFSLSRVDLVPAVAPMEYKITGPELLLCTAGTVQVAKDDGAIEMIKPGRGIWVPASTRKISLFSTDRARVYRTTVGHQLSELSC